MLAVLAKLRPGRPIAIAAPFKEPHGLGRLEKRGALFQVADRKQCAIGATVFRASVVFLGKQQTLTGQLLFWADHLALFSLFLPRD